MYKMRIKNKMINNLVIKSFINFKIIVVLVFATSMLFSGIFLTNQQISNPSQEDLIVEPENNQYQPLIESVNNDENSEILVERNFDKFNTEDIGYNAYDDLSYSEREFQEFKEIKIETKESTKNIGSTPKFSLQASYVPFNPISINGNVDFGSQAITEGWSGAGTVVNPYIIGGYNITGLISVTSIYIRNTDVYFIVQDNLIENSGLYGIDLSNVKNALIRNNIIYNSTFSGIFIDNSYANIIQNNEIYENSETGIQVSGVISTDNNISNNNIHNNGYYGISVYINASSNTIFGNDIYSNLYAGVYIGNGASNNLFNENSIYNNSWDGFYIVHAGTTDNNIFNNTINDNLKYGINNFQNSYGNNFVGNLIANNSWNGINLNRVNNVVVQNNTITSNFQSNLRLYYSNFTLVDNNILSSSNDHGIYNTGAINNVISNNVISNNSDYGVYSNGQNEIYDKNIFSGNELHGIYLVTGSKNNTVRNSQSYNNGRSGFATYFATNNTFENNIAYNNGWDGISLFYLSNSNFILNNTLYDQLNWKGLYIDRSHNNIVLNNTIMDNKQWGFLLYQAENTTIKFNKFYRDGLMMEGSSLANYVQTEINFNTVNNKPLNVIVNQNGGSVGTEVGQIILINSTGVEIAGHTISDTDVPILVVSSTNININQNNLFSNTGYGIVLHYTNQSTISNNEIYNNRWDGILTNLYSYNNLIEFNNIYNHNQRGIYLRYSNYATVENNYLDNNSWDVIALVRANYNVIRNNNLSNGDVNGIVLNDASFNTLSNLIVTNIRGNAMYVHSGSHNNTFTDILFDNTTKFSGISLYDSNFNSFERIKVTNVDDYGIYILRSNYTMVNDSSFTFNGYHGIYVYLSHYTSITNNIVFNNTFTGIGLRSSNNSVIEYNSVFNSQKWDGISNWNGAHASIINMNTVYGNGAQGILLDASTGVRVTNNSIYDNGHGFSITNAGDAYIFNNKLTRNSFYVWGNEVDDYNLQLINNTVNGKDVAFIKGKNTLRVTGDPGQVIIADSTMIIVTGLELSNVDYAIIVAFSNGVQIYNNSIYSNNDYLYLQNGAENTLVMWNNFRDNNLDGTFQARDEGINNTFSHNYWSDGPRIDPNRDGIVELPYGIFSNSVENYDYFPLANQYLGDGNLLTAPFVISPNGGEKLYNITSVKWEATTSLWNNPIVYDVYISGDNGQSWQLIATGVIGTSFFFDSSLLPDGDEYMIRVVAIDINNGLLAEDFSDSSFTINNTIVTSGGQDPGVDLVFAGGSLILLSGTGISAFFYIRRFRG